MNQKNKLNKRLTKAGYPSLGNLLDPEQPESGQKKRITCHKRKDYHIYYYKGCKHYDPKVTGIRNPVGTTTLMERVCTCVSSKDWPLLEHGKLCPLYGEPVKQECRCHCHHKYGYGKDCLTNGNCKGITCPHCLPTQQSELDEVRRDLDVSSSKIASKGEEGWEYDADYHKKLEKWHDRFFDTDRDVYFKIRDLIHQELSLSRQQERERIAKEIPEYFIQWRKEVDELYEKGRKTRKSQVLLDFPTWLSKYLSKEGGTE